MKEALLIALGVVLTLLSSFLLDFVRRKRQKNEGRAHLADLLLRLRGDLLWVAMLYEAPKDVTDPLGCPTTFFEFPRKLSKQTWELANSNRNELPVGAVGELEHLDEILQRAASHQDVARSKISRDPSIGKFAQVNVDDGKVVASRMESVHQDVCLAIEAATNLIASLGYEDEALKLGHEPNNQLSGRLRYSIGNEDKKKKSA